MWKQLITDLWKTCSFSYARSFSSQSVLIQLWLRTDPWLLAGWQWIYHIQQPELFLNVFCLFPVRMQPFLGCIDIFFVVLRALCPNLLSTSFVCAVHGFWTLNPVSHLLSLQLKCSYILTSFTFFNQSSKVNYFQASSYVQLYYYIEVIWGRLRKMS